MRNSQAKDVALARAVFKCKSSVTLVGGAEFSRADLTLALKVAPQLVAADSGADRLRIEGLQPGAVIGDMDSLSAAARSAFGPVMHEIAEQDSTDFDKALRHITAPLVVAVGFSGGRLDHELAALHGLLMHPERPCVIFGPESLTFLCPPEILLPLAVDSIVSLFPLATVRCASTGLRWPTDALTFAPDRRIGTSNAATGPVTLRPSGPSMLVILPKATLEPVAAALSATGARRWSGR